jgi:hypothetical protein
MLKGAERNYSATELESLAIIWAVEQFRPYLYGRKFTIESDHNPLVYIKDSKNKTSKAGRWSEILTEYNYEIVYKPGKLNVKADALSRNSSEEQVLQEANSIRIEDFETTKNKFKEEQDKDRWIKTLKEKSLKNYQIEDGLLYKKTNKGKKLIVVPESLRKVILKTCHDDIGGGHLGFRKTLPKIKERYYWPTIYKDTNNYCRACESCAKRKNPNTSHSEYHPIGEATYPFQMFVDEIVCRHSAPEILLSDQGKQFMSDLIKEVCNYLYTKKLNTTAYHPQCNGLTERFNATLCQMLAIRCSQDQTNWDEYINSSLFAYRASPHEVTKRSPIEILFGRTPRLPSNLEKLNKSDNYFLKDFSKNGKKLKAK